MEKTDSKSLRRFVDSLADVARELALQRFRTGMAVDSKQDRTPVTEADRAIEAELRTRISAAHPDHGILGEEFGTERGDAEYVWVLDPIDGTKAFASGKPLFGSLIGLLHHGRPVLGVIEAPATGERWVAAGDGVTLSGPNTCAVRPRRSLAEAVLCLGGPGDCDDPTSAHRLETLRSACRWANYQLDCYAYGLLASGHVDLVVERDLKLFDYCALVPVVTSAGGVITDWLGAPLGPRSDGTVVAATCPELAAEARALLVSAR